MMCELKRHGEASATDFEADRVARLSQVMGHHYDSARMAFSTIDDHRPIPVLSREYTSYSGFHQGAGETTVAELIKADLPEYGLILIDEIESSLHPRAQRRLLRDLAEHCRERQLQIILTTHSPYILEELPLEARVQILESGNSRATIQGVSPDFAMTKMDDETYPECELFVEDNIARIMLTEILAQFGRDLLLRCAIVPFGAASVGLALGQMIIKNMYPRRAYVFLDADNAAAPGCALLPGDDAPERIVFAELKEKRWADLWTHIGRDISEVSDACNNAMTMGDHHDWIKAAANSLMLGAEDLWRSMCREWTEKCGSAARFKPIIDIVGDQLD